MNERLHNFLDGDMPRSAATPDEQRELVETEAAIGGVLRAIPTRPMPDLSASVLQRLEGMAPPAAARPAPGRFNWRRVSGWFWSPREVSFAWRPAYAFAMGLMVLIAGTGLMTRVPAEAVGARQVFVQFRLDAPQASRVALAGNFTDWQPKLSLNRSAGGVWTIVVPLEEGVHNYAFVVDGKIWQSDPLAPSVSDGFGGHNSQIAVLSPDVAAQS